MRSIIAASRRLGACCIALLAIGQLLGAETPAPSATPAPSGPAPASTAAPAAAPAPTTAPAPAPARTPTPAAAPDAPLHWDYLPVVGYRGDGLYFSLRVGPSAPAWQVHAAGAHVLVQVGSDRRTVDAHLPLQGSIPDHIDFSGPHAQRRVRLAEPGRAAHLERDAAGRLRLDGDPAVLVEERIEADKDRRWESFRHQSATPDLHCAVTIAAPAVPPGDSGLLAAIAASQSQTVAGASVLVLVPGEDRLVGWKQREFRQALAWLVADLMARRARHVVLVDPIAPALEASLVEPLRASVEDVARAYHCRRVLFPELAEDRYWEMAPGVLGPTLNAAGKAALAHDLAPWR